MNDAPQLIKSSKYLEHLLRYYYFEITSMLKRVIDGNTTTEKLIGQYQERLDQITLKIEHAKKDPEQVEELRTRYKELKKELYKLYLQLDEEEAAN